jgi:hypothetical protein
MAIEIASLKSTLLTFDHLLRDDRCRFTRSQSLGGVRAFVKAFILDGVENRTQYLKTILGLQYDKLDELRRLRRLVTRPVSPFEHVMVASANMATRTLDAVWWLGSVDPYGFRLCTDWPDGPFTTIVVSGVLRGEDTTIHQLPIEFNCKLAPLRRAIVPVGTSAREKENTAREIAVFHREALQTAIDHTERNCPNHVRDFVVLMAQFNLQERGDGRVLGGMIRRLEMMFMWRVADSAKRKEFDKIVNRRANALRKEVLSEAVTSITEQPVRLTWDRWHQLYVKILNDLRPCLGLPGEIANTDAVIEGDG